MQSRRRRHRPVQRTSFSGQHGNRGGKTQSQTLLGTQDDIDEDVAARIENIDTVDKFQGSERKAVIVSTCVDTNPLRASDPHFINVACSLAQHLLVVVGNFSEGLASNEDWAYIRNQAELHGSYLQHRVTKLTTMGTTDREGEGGASSSSSFDIHKGELERKLDSLLDQPSNKRSKTATA